MRIRLASVLLGALFVFASCGQATLSVGGGGRCEAGATQPCKCANGWSGTQTCSSGLTFGACDCESAVVDAGPPVCGDSLCSGGETCNSCPDDCGPCPACDYAPSCTDAQGVPTTFTPRPDLNVGRNSGHPAPDAGVNGAGNCGPAQLRLRVQKIHTDKGGAVIYCVVNASDGTHSEVAITSKTKDLGDGDDFYFDPTVGVFWGQTALYPSTNNITVTYNCFAVKSDAWALVFMAAGNAAAQVAGVAGPYGWAFGLGDVGAMVAAAAIQAASGDDLMLNAQQTIDREGFLDLTNGRDWTVQQDQSGSWFFNVGAWDWTLTNESWGCADARSVPM